MLLGLGLGLYRSMRSWIPWTPTQITTSLWLDAADTSTITHDTGSVSQWNDKSGNGNHVSQGVSANQPSYANNTITFNGTSDYLFNTSPFMYDNGEIDVYIVTKGVNQLANRLITEGSSSVNQPIYAISQITGNTYKLSSYVRNDANNVLIDTPVLNDAVAFDDTTRIMNWKDDGDSLDGYLDGVAGNDVAYTRSGTLTLDRFSIGALLRGTSSAYYDGDINEIVILPSIASTADRQKLEGYLAHKWGLTANLPESHPWKNSAPTV